MPLSHLNPDGKATMVDVSAKPVTVREAIAESIVEVNEAVAAEFDGNDLSSKKGPVFQTAILAGTMAAKRTSELIPLCHPLPLDQIHVTIDFDRESRRARVRCRVRCSGRTGVEMEALTGVSIASLTLYDMVKALDPGVTIRETRLLEKTGGKSDFQA